MNYRLQICAALMLIFSAGCNKHLEGEFGVLQFSDMTKRPGFEFEVFPASVERAVTPNSIYRVRLSEPGLSANQLRTGDEGILRVIETRPISDLIDGEEIIVATEVLMHTGRPGSTRLIVDLEDERTDYVTITVIEHAKTEVVIAPDKQRFLGHDGGALADSQVALLPGAEIQLFGQALDESGDFLSGSNSSQWAVAGSGLVLTDESDEDDFVKVIGTQAGQDNTVGFGDSTPISVPTITEDSVRSIEILPQFIGQLEAGSVLLLHVAFRTEDGRLVIGEGSGPVQVMLSDGLSLVELTETDGYFALYNAFFKPDLNASRDIFIKADAAGDYTITAQWNGLSHETTLTIH